MTVKDQINLHSLLEKKVGQVAVLERKPRFIYYLITKVKVTERPTYYNLKASLEDLKKHCVDNGVQTLAMPHLGCGLNRLVWGKVKTIICEVFANTKIHITVYVLECKKKLPYNDCTQGNCMRIIWWKYIKFLLYFILPLLTDITRVTGYYIEYNIVFKKKKLLE